MIFTRWKNANNTPNSRWIPGNLHVPLVPSCTETLSRVPIWHFRDGIYQKTPPRQTVLNCDEHLSISHFWFLLTLNMALMEYCLEIVDPLIKRTRCHCAKRVPRQSSNHTSTVDRIQAYVESPMKIYPSISEILKTILNLEDHQRDE